MADFHYGGRFFYYICHVYVCVKAYTVFSGGHASGFTLLSSIDFKAGGSEGILFQ
jgi:hypothetical protein